MYKRQEESRAAGAFIKIVEFQKIPDSVLVISGGWERGKKPGVPVFISLTVFQEERKYVKKEKFEQRKNIVRRLLEDQMCIRDRRLCGDCDYHIHGPGRRHAECY